MPGEIVVEQPKSLMSNDDQLPKNSEYIQPDISIESMHQNTVWEIRLGEWASKKKKNNIPGNCYPKLELLSISDKIIIIRQFKLYNRDNAGNRYLIKDKKGENLYYGIEKIVSCDCCGGNRSFNLSFYDRNKTLVSHLERPFRFGSCCIFPCCLQVSIHCFSSY